MSYAKAISKDIYSQITETVIEALEQGNIIWHKPWNSYGLPKNYTTGRQYRGWNVFWLNFITSYKQYSTPYFLTFNQAKKTGGRIKKGSKGTPIVFWAEVEDKRTTMVVTDEATGEEISIHPTKLIPTTHTVFNLDQTEEMDLSSLESLARKETNNIEACENIIKNMQSAPSIRHFGDRAYYSLMRDQVTMPAKNLFVNDEAYYTTLFHELAHSTGHEKRLDRKELLEHDGFGGENYSKEELTAEFAAAFLSGITGIQPATINNSTAYIKGWLKSLKDDKKLLLTAANQAQKASDFILGINPHEEKAL
ncbi:MAG TPA: zincin-like metallopeptidase domain-containing protein [Segetibacter sp.]